MSEHRAGRVLHDGEVGRGVFHPKSWARLTKGNASALRALFNDAQSPVNLSVHRLNIRPDGEVAKIGDEQAKKRREASRSQNIQFLGWAVLTVRHASGGGREVRTLREWWHAEIVLPCKADDTESRKFHLAELASDVSFRDRP